MMAGRLTLLVATLSCATAQLLPRCPNYQTTVNFTQQFADQMQRRAGGYIVRLSNGATDACQRLQFVDGNDFNVSFIDVANYEKNYTNRYTMKTADSTKPAKLHLTMHPRLMGADSSGDLQLYPIVARDDMVAFVSCIERGLGLFITEQVLVVTPYNATKNVTDQQIKSVLHHNKVPRINELKNISTSCVPKPFAAPNPLSLDLYNLVSNLMNPFGGVSRVAVTYGSPNQNPIDAAQQVMNVFREAGVSPAQFYAQTGSTVMQTGAQSLYYNQNPLYYNSQPAYYDNALHVAQSAANAAHWANYNPEYPTQYHHHNAIPGTPTQYHHHNTNPGTPTQAAGVDTNVMSIGVAPHSHGFGMTAAEYATGNVHAPTGSVQNPSGSVYNPSGPAYKVQTSYNPIGKTHQQNIPAHGNYPNNNNLYSVQPTPTGSNQAHLNYY